MIDINSYVIVRTYSAGCFAGILTERNGREVLLTNARRLWEWYGAASLSELAARGPSLPEQCKFAVPVTVLLLEAIEIIDAAQGRTSIESVPIWSR